MLFLLIDEGARTCAKTHTYTRKAKRLKVRYCDTHKSDNQLCISVQKKLDNTQIKSFLGEQKKTCETKANTHESMSKNNSRI